MVTPKFLGYLIHEFGLAWPYVPVYHVNATSIRPLAPKAPYILLGLKLAFELRESYSYRSSDPESPEPLDLYKIPAPVDDNFVSISRFGNVAIAHIFPFPIPNPFTSLALARNMWKYFSMKPERVTQGKGALRNTLDMIDPGNSLSFIVDIPMEVRMAVDIVDSRDGTRIGGQKELLRKFIVTLRSKHVTPNWKFSSDTVQWYIDDINLSNRRVKWSDGL